MAFSFSSFLTPSFCQVCDAIVVIDARAVPVGGHFGLRENVQAHQVFAFQYFLELLAHHAVSGADIQNLHLVLVGHPLLELILQHVADHLGRFTFQVISHNGFIKTGVFIHLVVIMYAETFYFPVRFNLEPLLILIKAVFSSGNLTLKSLDLGIFCTPLSSHQDLVAVMIRFERSVHGYADVSRLIGAQLGELGAQVVQVQPGHLLIQVLGQSVDPDFIVVPPQIDLGQGLIGEELDITKLGWPVAQPRFTRRPSASTRIERP